MQRIGQKSCDVFHFNKMGMGFTILRNEQRCYGDMALKLSEREPSKGLAEANPSLFEKCKIEKLNNFVAS